MRIGSLFTGAGGLDMGVTAAIGGSVAWHCEVDRDASRILAARYPDVPNLGDITAVDWTQVEPVDVLTGGFPCQDLSTAGVRRGLRPGTRSGLWEHMAYAVDALRPDLVVVENVRGLLSADAHSDVEPCPICLGDGPDGALRALGAVLGDLADLGYDARWCGVRAADVGAPHNRFRVFVVAYPSGDGRGEGWPESAGVVGGLDAAECGGATPTDCYGVDGDGGRTVGTRRGAEPANGSSTPADTGGQRHGSGQDAGSVGRVDRDDADQARQRQRARQEPAHRSGTVDFGPYTAAVQRWSAVLGRPAPDPTEPGANGPRLSPRFVEWMMGWPDDWTDVGISRNARLKVCGNGVVPQQAAHALALMGVS